MIEKGVRTSQDLYPSGRSFQVADSPPPCFKDRWGEWLCECEHDHEADMPLQDVYQWIEGWTVQG